LYRYTEDPPFIFDFTLLQWVAFGSIASFGLCCAGCTMYFKSVAKKIRHNMKVAIEGEQDGDSESDDEAGRLCTAVESG
jgi:hypothetical protein